MHLSLTLPHSPENPRKEAEMASKTSITPVAGADSGLPSNPLVSRGPGRMAVHIDCP